MSEPHHHDLVQRVVRTLDEAHDPDSLVWQYFDRDRDAVIQAAQQTLEATREDASRERVARAVDQELIEGLRFPARMPVGVLATLYLRRGRVAAALVALLTAALGLLLL